MVGKDRDELKPIIESIAGHFDLRVIYTTSAIGITEANKPKIKISALSFILLFICSGGNKFVYSSQ